mgnify:CR=1 FL=1
MRRNHVTDRPWEAAAGFSRAVRIGNLIETSLTSPAGPDGEILFPGDVYRQTRQCLAVIGESLTALGASYEDVIKTRIYVGQTDHWKEAGRVHAEVFGTIRPALGFVYMIGFFDPAITVEVEATAWVERA